MTNYQKYFGTEEKIVCLMAECGAFAELFSKEFCELENKENTCIMKNGEINCNSENFGNCIFRWLKKISN